MRISRRRLLISAMAAGAASVLAGLGSLGIGRDRLRAWYYALPDDGAGRRLSEGCDRTLGRVAETLLELPVDTAHYEDFFRWRAAHLPGHGTFYERVAANLDDLARARAGRPFVDCDLEARRAILAPVRRLRGGRPSRLRLAVVGRDWLLLERYIVDPVFDLFAHTDAWVLAGYDTWPGRPTGLDAYLRASGARAAEPLESG